MPGLAELAEGFGMDVGTVSIVASGERLEGAGSVAEVLDAAYDAFEEVMAAIDGSLIAGGPPASLGGVPGGQAGQRPACPP